ncbi:MAG: translation initiation factor IF-2 [Planctomycetota bacterium]|jgi:translation initiation factor IF-2
MATTRVYILAKELGVKSSAIVGKCQDEGLDIKNHMSVISAGLAATIREWFSEGDNVTTIETSQKVDLKKVRIKKKRKRATKKDKDQEVEAVATTVEEVEVVSEVSQEEVVETPVTEVQETVVPDKAVAEVVQSGPVIIPEPEAEPEPVVPAGPMLEKPEPAKLNGPQIIRVEAPEPVRAPRPRPRSKAPRYDAPATEPLMYDKKQAAPAETVDGDKKRTSPKRHKDRTHGRRRDEKDTESAKRGKQVSRWRQRDIDERKARLDAAGGEGLRSRPTRRISSKGHSDLAAPHRPEKAVVTEPITIKDLSAALAVKTSDIMGKLISQGIVANINQTISNEAAELVAVEFGIELTVEKKSRLEDQILEEFQGRERKKLTRRAVVATMLGHVDHGKTSLLDRIRSTEVTASEAGGITQHIGAYQVSHKGGKVTFLDTPGHEAFTAMRARGANMTDVAVLVIAADDGVMPQTVEAIAHCKAAEVQIIVALNKIDLPGCDINRIFSQLTEQELTPAEWGGETEVVKTSATTGEGVEDLLEHLDYIAELLELQADDTIPATGWVVEARMSSRRGAVATLLINEGLLRKGDIVLCGSSYGRVKTIKDSFGKSLKKAFSSMPVEITGLNDVPEAGDRFYRLEDLNKAKTAAEENKQLARESSLAQREQVTLDNLFSQIEAGNVKELNIIIRADVQGSVDVLKKYLTELSTEEIKIKILHAAPGGITEGDVVLAEASNAIIIGFNVVGDDRVNRIAEESGVDIRLYSVIYRITEDLEKSMVGLLEPEEQEKSLGRAVVRMTFKISRIGTIAGCYVNSGVVTKNAKARLIRDNVVIRDNLSIESLKHLKDDVREAKAGFECGIKLARFDDVKVDDVFDFYEIVQVARTL